MKWNQVGKRVVFSSIAAAIALAICPNPAAADTLNLGTAGQFSVFGINGGTVNINDSNPDTSIITGNVGIGPGESATLNKVTIAGNLLIDSTAGSVTYGSQFNITGTIQTGVNLSGAATDAITRSAFYAALPVPAGHALGVLGDNDSRSLTGNGGTNVYSITSLNYNSDFLDLTGTATDVFIFNVAGTFMWSQSDVILHGISANQVLFNFLGADPVSGDSVEINKSDTDFSGIVLGVNRSIRYHNDAHFVGNIIGKNITIDSGASLTGVTVPVGTPGEVPLPSTAWAGLGLMGVLGASQLRRPRHA